MKVAVTAASGQLGAAIITQLINDIGKENVIGIARTPTKAEDLGIQVLKGDYDNQSDFDAALKGVDVVLIVSGMDHPDKRIDQHRNVINAAKEASVKKIVYTSIIGDDGKTSFDAIVKSNRQTEKDIQKCGLKWAIGRNGLYIEPDVEYIENYKKDGKIVNCAGEGLCSYTTREELAFAYAKLIQDDAKNEKIYNLAGEAITQKQLSNYLNLAFGTDLIYEEISPEAYLAMQQELNGEFMGMAIAGIYTKIRNGEFNIKSDFETAAGRKHVDWNEYFEKY